MGPQPPHMETPSDHPETRDENVGYVAPHDGEETRALPPPPPAPGAATESGAEAKADAAPGEVQDTAPQIADWVGNAHRIAAASNVITPARNSRFVLREVLGRGGFGEVWESVQTSLWRLIAVKRPRLDLIQSPLQSPGSIRQQEIQFYQEAMTMAALDHPNIVPVYDLGVDGNGLPIVAMKKVQGQSWQDLIMDEFNAGSVQQFLERHVRIMIDCANAVAFAHSRGIIHRDIKPAQVIVGEYGETLLTDWGVAVVFDTARAAAHNPLFLESGYAPDRTKAVSPAGTWAFMAPEQTLRTAEKLGPWTDIYLLGGTLYYLLTGRPPHDGRTAEETMQFAANGYVAPVHQANAVRYIPADLAYLAMRCMAPSPNQRPDSMESVIHELREWVSGSSHRREALEILRKLRAEFNADNHPNYEKLAEWEDSLARATALCPGEDEAYELGQILAERHASTALRNEDLNLAGAYAKRLTNPTRRAHVEERIAAVQTGRRQIHFQRVAAVAVSITLFVMVLALYLLATRRASEAQAGQESARLETQRRVRQAEIADQRRRHAEQEQYLASLQFAQSAIGEGQFATAMQSLLAGEPSLRNWEWEWLAARCHRELLILPHKGGTVRDLAWLPTGDRVATIASDGHLRLWSAADGTLLATRHLDPPVDCTKLVISPDGKHIAVGAADGRILVVATDHLVENQSGGTRVASLTGSAITSLKFSADSAQLLAADGTPGVIVWQTAGFPTPQFKLRGHGPVAQAFFSPNQRTIVLAGPTTPITFFDREAGKQTHQIPLPMGSPRLTVALSPDGRQVATGYQNGAVRIADSLTGAEISSLPSGDSAVRSIIFSPDGTLVAVSFRNRKAILGDTETGRLVRTVDSHRGEIIALNFSHRGARLATAGKDANMVIHDVATGSVLETLPGHSRPLTSVSFSPDGLRLGTTGEDGTARLWQSSPPSASRSLSTQGGPVRWVASSSDGSYLVSASDDGTLRKIGMPSGIQVGEISLGKPPTAIGWSSTGELLCAATADGPIRLISTSRMAVLQEVRTESPSHPASVSSLCFGPNQTLIGGMSDGSLRTWSLESGNLTGHIHVTTASIRSLDRAAGSNLLAAVDSSGLLTMLDTQVIAHASPETSPSEQVRQKLICPEGLYSVRFNPEGTALVTAGADGLARLHATATGSVLQELRGHVDEVRCAIWFPTGKRLVTVGKDSTLRLWDSEEGREILTIPTHNDTIHWAALTPDSLNLITASHDRTLNQFTVPSIPGNENLTSLENWEELLIERRREMYLQLIKQSPERLMPPGYERALLFSNAQDSQGRLEHIRGQVELARRLVDTNDTGVKLSLRLLEVAASQFQSIPQLDRTIARQWALEVLHPAALVAVDTGQPTTAGLQLCLDAYNLAVAQWTMRRITAHDSALILHTMAELLDRLRRPEEARIVRRRALLCAHMSVPRDRYLMDQPLGLRGPEFIEQIERRIRLNGETLPPPLPDELIFGSNRTRTNWLPGWITYDQWRDADEEGRNKITAEIDRRIREYLDREAPMPDIKAMTIPRNETSQDGQALLSDCRNFVLAR